MTLDFRYLKISAAARSGPWRDRTDSFRPSRDLPATNGYSVPGSSPIYVRESHAHYRAEPEKSFLEELLLPPRPCGSRLFHFPYFLCVVLFPGKAPLEQNKNKGEYFFRSEPTLIPELQRVAPLALNLCDFSKCIDYCSKSQSFVNRGLKKLPTNRISVPVPDIPLWLRKTPPDRNPGTISPKRRVGNWRYPTS